MISLEQAQSRLIALAHPLEEETVLLPEAIGRWTAAPVKALRTQPARDLSAMDGYALAHADLPGPVRVIGESAAGAGFKGVIAPREAVRIFTGAPLPAGADTVIMQEDVSRDGAYARLAEEIAVPKGQHVRRAGGDFVQGATLIDAGDRLTPARIALAASSGHGRLCVRRKPTIEILATGNELVSPGDVVGEDQLPESNTIMIATMLRDYRCAVSSPGIVPDDVAALTAAIGKSTADILVTCGGASVGDHDLVRPALAACGAELDFWRVAMRPGKPLMAGRRGKQIVLGLPGNPVSAFVTAFLFLRPLVASLSGAADCLPARSMAMLGTPLPANGDRTDHIRAHFVGGQVLPVGMNDSAALLALSQAECLIVREPGARAANSGATVEILRI